MTRCDVCQHITKRFDAKQCTNCGMPIQAKPRQKNPVIMAELLEKMDRQVEVLKDIKEPKPVKMGAATAHEIRHKIKEFERKKLAQNATYKDIEFYDEQLKYWKQKLEIELKKKVGTGNRAY